MKKKIIEIDLIDIVKFTWIKKFQLLSLLLIPMLIYLIYQYKLNKKAIYISNEVYQTHISQRSNSDLESLLDLGINLNFNNSNSLIGSKNNIVQPVYYNDLLFTFVKDILVSDFIKKKLAKELEKNQIKKQTILQIIKTFNVEKKRLEEYITLTYQIDDTTINQIEKRKIAMLIGKILNYIAKEEFAKKILENIEYEISLIQKKQIPLLAMQKTFKEKISNDLLPNLIQINDSLIMMEIRLKLLESNLDALRETKKKFTNSLLYKTKDYKIANFEYIKSTNKLMINDLKIILLIIVLSILLTIFYFIAAYTEYIDKKSYELK